MSRLFLLQVAVALLGPVLMALEATVLDHRFGRGRLSRIALGFVAAANIGFLAFVFFNHAPFPLHLDLLEGTILQHVQRAASLQPIYPSPSSDYVPLAYNPLYYYLTVPFTWIFGERLFTLRLVAILGAIGSAAAVFVVVRQKTRSSWWGLMALGLFAAAYRAMDTYLDNGHSDSWFLCVALWGTFFLDHRSRLANLGGILLLVSSFWFKQHGAVFAVGGLVYLTCREGLWKSLPYWLVALATGPISYLFLGPSLFGSRFHYFTWEVPSHWSALNFATVTRYVGIILRFYPLLALASGLWALTAIWREGRRVSIWPVQLLFAAATGLMGALDEGSANNVFIAMGTWLILVGTCGLHDLAERKSAIDRWHLAHLALLLSFTLLLYDPRSVLVSPQAQASYGDFMSYLKSLPGTVYAPWIGQLENGYTFYPAAHWAAMEDMVRGPGRSTRNRPEVRRLLAPCLEPAGPAFLLINWPLDENFVYGFLNESYTLQADLGDRFKPLSALLAKRYFHGWPRYLYRYQPKTSD